LKEHHRDTENTGCTEKANQGKEAAMATKTEESLVLVSNSNGIVIIPE
jgi:hypothetical protein